MNMKNKSIYILSSLLALGVISSCSTTPKWDYVDEDINDAVRLNASAQLDEKLIIDISSDSSFFKSNIKKEDIIVAPKLYFGSGEDEAITFNDVKEHQVDNFTFAQFGDKNVTITLNDKSPSAYYVFFDKNATIDHVLSYASVFTYQTDNQLMPIFGTENNRYYAGVSSPTFVINYNDVEVDNTHLITFSRGFNDLEVMTTECDNGKITITTDGMIGEDKQGIINLNEGFFKGVNYDVKVYFDIISSYVYLDQESFKYSDNEFTFNVKTVEKEYLDTIKKENVIFDEALDKINLKSVIRRDDMTIAITLTVTDEELNALDKVIVYLDKTNITFVNALKDFNNTFALSFSVDYPSLVLFPTFDFRAHKFKLSGRAYNLKEGSFAQDDIIFESSNIEIDKNIKIDAFNSANKGFSFDMSILNDTSHLYGAVKCDESKIQTLWGNNFPLEGYFDSKAITLSIQSEDKIIDDILNSPIVMDQDLKGISLDQSLPTFSFTIGEGQFGPALTCLSEFLRLSDIVYPLDGSNYDYFNNYKSLFDDTTLYNLASLDDFGELIQDGDAYDKYNADRTAYKEMQDALDSCYQKYITPMLDMFHAYQDKYVQEILRLNTIHQSTYRAVTLDDWDDEGNLGCSIMHPEEPYFSIEDYDIDDMYITEVYDFYFKEAVEEYKKENKYTREVERLLRQDIARFLAIPNFSNEMKYSTLQAFIFLNIADEGDAEKFNDLYMNFASEIGKEYENSLLTAYYNNLTSLYNFQSEINQTFRRFLADMKLKLELFGAFSQILNLFSLSKIDYHNTLIAVQSADKAITQYNYLKELKEDEDYSYVIDSVFKHSLVSIDYDISYSENGSINSSVKIIDTKTNEELETVNNNTMINDKDYQMMYNRYLALKELCMDDSIDFMNYLIKQNVFGLDPAQRYELMRYQSAFDKGETLPDYPLPVLTSFTGFYDDLMDKSVTGYCASHYGDNNSLYTEGKNYTFGSDGDSLNGSKRSWSYLELRGTILDLSSMTSSEVGLNAVATYNQTIWNNGFDDHYLFKRYENGFYTFVLFRI